MAQNYYGGNYSNPYGYTQSAQQTNPSNPWAWGQKALGMTAEANDPFRQWMMQQMQGYQSQYGQGPQTGGNLPQFGQTGQDFTQGMPQYNQGLGDLMSQYGGNMPTVFGAGGQGGYGGQANIPQGQLPQPFGVPQFGDGGGYGGGQTGYGGTPPYTPANWNIPQFQLPESQSLQANMGDMMRAQEGRMAGAESLLAGGITPEEQAGMIQRGTEPIAIAGTQNLRQIQSMQSAKGMGTSGMTETMKLRSHAATQGAMGDVAGRIGEEAIRQRLASQQAGVAALAPIAGEERAAEQMGFGNMLATAGMAQQGAIAEGQLGLQRMQTEGQLGLAGRELGIREQQGMGQLGLGWGELGLQQQMQPAQLQWEMEQGRSQMGMQRELTMRQQELDRALGEGRIDVSQYQSETQRLDTLLQSTMQQQQLGQQQQQMTGNFALEAERLAIQRYEAERGMDIQEVTAQRQMDIQEAMNMMQMGYQYWQLPQKLQSALALQWMSSKMGQNQGSGFWEIFGGAAGQAAGAYAGSRAGG